MTDGELKQIELTGDVRLGLSALRCDKTWLAATALADAKITLDQDAMLVKGSTGIAIDPRFVLKGAASLTATFTSYAGGWSPDAADWSINLCGASLIGPLLDLVQTLDCLNLDVSGPKSCSN